MLTRQQHENYFLYGAYERPVQLSHRELKEQIDALVEEAKRKCPHVLRGLSITYFPETLKALQEAMRDPPPSAELQKLRIEQTAIVGLLNRHASAYGAVRRDQHALRGERNYLCLTGHASAFDVVEPQSPMPSFASHRDARAYHIDYLLPQVAAIEAQAKHCAECVSEISRLNDGQRAYRVCAVLVEKSAGQDRHIAALEQRIAALEGKPRTRRQRRKS